MKVLVLFLSFIWLAIPEAYGSARPLKPRPPAKQPVASKPAEAPRQFTVLTACRPHQEVSVLRSADKHSEAAFTNLSAAEALVPSFNASCRELKKSLQGTTQAESFAKSAEELKAKKDAARISSNTARIELNRAETASSRLGADEACLKQIRDTFRKLTERMKAVDAASRKIEAECK